MRTHSGFTLIELICVIVVMSIGILGLVRMLQQTREGPIYAMAMQDANQLAQECAELLLDTRRTAGYSAVNTSTCNGLALPSGYTRTLQSASTTTSACPNNVACTYWKVAVTAPADSASVSSTAVVMLVQY